MYAVSQANRRQRFSSPLYTLMLFVFLWSSAGCIAPIKRPTPKETDQRPCVDPATITLQDAATAEDALATAENIINCINTGHYREAALQVASELLQAEFGFSDPNLAPERLAGLPPFVVEALSNPQQQADGQFSIDILYRRELGAHMLVHERWGFVAQDGLLLLASLTPLPVVLDANAVTVDVRMLDFAYTLSQTTFAVNSTVVFQMSNEGDYPHEFVVFRLPEDVTIDAVRQGQFSEEFQFVGVTSAAAGQTATDLVLVDLEPGAYAVVCFVDEPEGMPHMVRGMIAEFTVQ